MSQWRSKTEQNLERQLADVQNELQKLKQADQDLQQQYRMLKIQNDRLLKMEAQHQSAKRSLLEKRIIFSRAVILFPENMVIGDRLENCVLKIYRGNNLTLTDTAELINCRIVGLEHYPDGSLRKPVKTPGTIDIRGIFYNTYPRRFAISTYERVVIQRGVRFRGNIRAGSIVVSELSKVRGRFATRELLEKTLRAKELLQMEASPLNRMMPGGREIQIENRQ